MVSVEMWYNVYMTVVQTWGVGYCVRVNMTDKMEDEDIIVGGTVQ